MQVGKNLELLAVTCPWKGTAGISRFLLSTEAELLGGDVRATLDGRVQVGVVVKRGRIHEQVSFALTSSGSKVEPTISPLPADEGTTVIRVRLDERGKLHLLLRNSDRLSYVSPEMNADVWVDEKLARAGRFFDLLLRPDFPATLVSYDAARGPISVRL